MKFDVVVGNPPFSKTNEGKTSGKKAVNLYPAFYKKSIEVSDIVAMVMPDTGSQLNKLHNDYVKESAYTITKVTVEQQKNMGVGIKMWVVHYNKKIPANAIHYFNNMSPMNDIEFTKGKTNISGSKIQVSESKDNVFKHPIYKSVYKNGPNLVYSNTEFDKTLPSSGYCVLIPLTMGENGWNVYVRPCNGEAVNVNVNYVLFDSMDDAELMKSYLESLDFTQSALPLRGNQGIMTVGSLKAITVNLTSILD